MDSSDIMWRLAMDSSDSESRFLGHPVQYLPPEEPPAVCPSVRACHTLVPTKVDLRLTPSQGLV